MLNMNKIGRLQQEDKLLRDEQDRLENMLNSVVSKRKAVTREMYKEVFVNESSEQKESNNISIVNISVIADSNADNLFR